MKQRGGIVVGVARLTGLEGFGAAFQQSHDGITLLVDGAETDGDAASEQHDKPFGWLRDDQTAESTIRVAEMLFTLYGPPLVAKSDNGPAFVSGAWSKMLNRWCIPHFVPRRTRPGTMEAVKLGSAA